MITVYIIKLLITAYFLVGAFTAGVSHGMAVEPKLTMREHFMLWFAWPYLFWSGYKCK